MTQMITRNGALKAIEPHTVRLVSPEGVVTETEMLFIFEKDETLDEGHPDYVSNRKQCARHMLETFLKHNKDDRMRDAMVAELTGNVPGIMEYAAWKKARGL